MPRTKSFLSVVVIVTVLVLGAAPALALVVSPTPLPGASDGPNTELTLSATGEGRSVSGFIATEDSTFDPVHDAYPANPTTGFVPKDESFAGVIIGTPTGGGAQLKMYCIDILTETNIGIGYELGTWETADVANVGYVARLLTEFYPNTDAPASVTDVNQKAAAVQAAIWFFSDRYVLNTAEGPLYDAVVAITDHIRDEGPLVQPLPPTLIVTPPAISAPEGTVIGPYTVTSSTTPTTVTATGATMFSDAAGTVPIPNGMAVPSGQQVWLKEAGAASAVLEATATATVPGGNVYLYDGNSPPKVSAQRLILAQTATLKSTVTAHAQFLAPGNLTVTKTIEGSGAGLQGEITIVVTCNGAELTPVFTIAAGAPAGTTTSQTYTGIAAGSVCTVVETVDGHTASVTVTKPRSGQTVTIRSGETVTAGIIDTYETGSLVVSKTITGPGAGQQGAVTIEVACGGTALAPFVIPAGTPAGTMSQPYPGILAGTVCTATETANGASAIVTVTTTGNPQTVTIAPNGSGSADIVDTYDLVPGNLTVTKTIAGPAAGLQGGIAILIDCGVPPNVHAFLIAPGEPAGPVLRTVNGIPGGSTCVVTEVVDGGTSTVSVIGVGSGQSVVVSPAATATADLTNTFAVVSTPTTPAPTTPTTPSPTPVATGVIPTPPTASRTSEPTVLPPTGSSDGAHIALVGLIVGALGATLVVVTRRRAAPRG